MHLLIVLPLTPATQPPNNPQAFHCDESTIKVWPVQCTLLAPLFMTPHITTCHQKASASAPSGASLAELLLDTIALIHGQRTTAVAVGSQTAPDPEASSRLGTHTAAARA